MGAANCSTCNCNWSDENTVELKEALKKSRQNSTLNKITSTE